MKKLHFLLGLFVSVTLLSAAQGPVKKPVQPVAEKAGDGRAKIEAAVKAKVTAYFMSKDRMIGSTGAYVRGVNVKIDSTEAMSGWPGKWQSSGAAELSIGGGGVNGGSQKQTRTFSAYATVKANGSVEVTDVSG